MALSRSVGNESVAVLERFGGRDGLRKSLVLFTHDTLHQKYSAMTGAPDDGNAM